MYKSIHFILILFTTFFTEKAFGQWSTVGNAGFTSGSVYELAVATDSSGAPYIASNDASSSSKVSVMKWSGSSWVYVGNAGISGGSFQYLTMTINPSNNYVYVAYTDYSASSKLTVKEYNGSSWTSLGGTGITAGSAKFIGLTIYNNAITAIYSDGNNSNKAAVITYNGSSWVSIGSTNITSNTVQDCSITADGSGNLFAAYRDNSGKAYMSKWNGSSWSSLGQASQGGCGDLTCAVDDNSVPYVGYIDYTSSNKATVRKYTNSSWSTVGSAGFSANSVTYPSIAVDDNNIPYVSYSDHSNNSKLSVMRFKNNSWSYAGSAGISSNKASNVRSVISSDNSLYVTFSDKSSGKKATVMEYTQPTNVWNGSSWSEGAPDSTTKVVIKSDNPPVSFECKDIIIDSGVALNIDTNNTIVVHGNITNNGKGINGKGDIVFDNPDTTQVLGDTLDISGTIKVESGAKLSTNGLIRLVSDSSGSGSIGATSGVIVGDVIVQRYNIKKRAFRFFGHPFSVSIPLSYLSDEIDITGPGGSANGFTNTISNNPSAFYFDAQIADTTTAGNNSGWLPFTSALTASWDRYELIRLMVRGSKGQGLNGQSYNPDAAIFECTAPINQGTQVVTLTKGQNSPFVACGNPFPSGVQMNAVDLGSDIGANYYVWDASIGDKGGYVTNPFSLPYVLPMYGAFFTTSSGNTNNTITFEENDKESGGATVFKGTGNNDYWIELSISDSNARWDRLLVSLDDNSIAEEDAKDAKKLYNPSLDFYTLSNDGVRLAVDSRPYKDSSSILIGLTAYNRYNTYTIEVGMFDIPNGAKLFLHDKYLNKKVQLTDTLKYSFNVTSDTASQGTNRFEINMVGKPTNGIASTVNMTNASLQLIPNPARDEVNISYVNSEEIGIIQLLDITGKTIYKSATNTKEGSINIPLSSYPDGIYIVELRTNKGSISQKLIKQN